MTDLEKKVLAAAKCIRSGITDELHNELIADWILENSSISGKIGTDNYIGQQIADKGISNDHGLLTEAAKAIAEVNLANIDDVFAAVTVAQKMAKKLLQWEKVGDVLTTAVDNAFDAKSSSKGQFIRQLYFLINIIVEGERERCASVLDSMHLSGTKEGNEWRPSPASVLKLAAERIRECQQ